MDRTKSLKKIGFIAIVLVPILCGTVWTNDVLAQHSVTLNSAVINGTNITSTQSIVVGPNEPLSGEVRVTVTNGDSRQTVVPVAATPNWKWGGFSSNEQIYTELDPSMPAGSYSYSYTLPAGLTAPDDPGTYYIGIFNGTVYTSQQLMSCDGFPLDQPPVYHWDTENPGDPAAPDVADWTRDLWEQAATGDHVEGFDFCHEESCIYGYYGGTAIRVVVLEATEYEPVADTFISSSSHLTWVGNKKVMERDANFGTNGGLSVIRGVYGGWGSFTDWRGTLIRFDLSDIPVDAEIFGAELSLYHYSVWSQLVSIHRMQKDWTELGATWYQPCEGCEPWWTGWNDGNYVEQPTDTQWVTYHDRWFSWNVKEDVQSFVSGAPNYGWFLKSAATGGTDRTSASFYSKETYEKEFVPYLRVQFSVPPPEVSFSADPESILSGGASTLTWTTRYADRVSITPGIGDVDPNGSMEVSPTTTTTYTLIAQGRGGTTTKTATVTVVSVPPTVSLSVVPDTILPGQPSTLSWSSTDAETAMIAPGIGAVPVNGSITVSPAQTTTYVITVTGPGGSATASATVTVISNPPTVTLTASPGTIQVGESATLSWSSTNADSATIDPGIGSVPVNGSITVSPIQTTTYTITVQGPGGSATASATVTVMVTYPAPTVSISADPLFILPTQSSTLTWTSTDAETCSIEPGIGSVSLNGSITVSPSRTTTYTITATGPGGTATASVEVTVIR